MKLPVDIRELMNSGKSLAEERLKPVRIAVFVDVDAPSALIDEVREALRPQMSTARLQVELNGPSETLLIDPMVDAVIGIAGEGTVLAHSLESARDKTVPTVALALASSPSGVSRRLGHPFLDTLAAPEPEEVVKLLGKWLADRVIGKRVALASNFEFVRRAVAEEAIRATAFQNAVIGFVAIIPGADMPLMTANQGKMVLQIAAAYGQPLGRERIKELAVVVGGGFTLRAVARQLLDFVPGFGWALKAAIGYTGTLAMGYAALEYFEEGGDVHALADRLRTARDEAVESARSGRWGRRRSERETIQAHGYVVPDLGAPALDAPASASDTGAVDGANAS